MDTFAPGEAALFRKHTNTRSAEPDDFAEIIVSHLDALVCPLLVWLPLAVSVVSGGRAAAAGVWEGGSQGAGALRRPWRHPDGVMLPDSCREMQGGGAGRRPNGLATSPAALRAPRLPAPAGFRGQPPTPPVRRLWLRSGSLARAGWLPHQLSQRRQPPAPISAVHPPR